MRGGRAIGIIVSALVILGGSACSSASQTEESRAETVAPVVQVTTWYPQDVPNGGGRKVLTAVSFADSQNGWAVGYRGRRRQHRFPRPDHGHLRRRRQLASAGRT